MFRSPTLSEKPLQKDLFCGAVGKDHSLRSIAAPMEDAPSSPVMHHHPPSHPPIADAIAIRGQFCVDVFHLGITPSALFNGWCDRPVHFLRITPFIISWKSECSSIVAVLFFQNALVTITD